MMRPVGVLLAAILLFAARPARAESVPAFLLPAGLEGGDSLWSDGEDLLIVQREAALYEIQRGSEPVFKVLPNFRERRTHATGAGRGAQAVVAVWGERTVAIRRGGEWQTSEIPGPQGDCLGATDAAGRFYCAREAGSLAIWQGEQWTVYDPPLPDLKLTGVAVGAGGTVYLVDQRARVLSFGSGAFHLHRFRGLSKTVQKSEWSGAHYSPDSSLLWVGTSAEGLLSLDLASGQGREHLMPDLHDEKKDSGERRDRVPRMRSLRGGRAGGRDVLWMRGQERLFLYDGRNFLITTLREFASQRYVHDVTLCLREAAAYAATNEGLVRVAVKAEILGSGAGWVMAPAERRIIPLPTIRLGLGPVWGITGEGALGPALALDLTFGVGLLWQRGKMTDWGPWVQPELGWGWNNDGLRGGSLFLAGLGVGYGSGLLGVTYTPRLVVGTAGDQRAIGLRHGLVVHLLLDMLAVEVSHQLLSAGELQHDVRLMISVNPVPLLIGLVALAASQAIGAGITAIPRRLFGR